MREENFYNSLLANENIFAVPTSHFLHEKRDKVVGRRRIRVYPQIKLQQQNGQEQPIHYLKIKSP